MNTQGQRGVNEIHATDTNPSVQNQEIELREYLDSRSENQTEGSIEEVNAVIIQTEDLRDNNSAEDTEGLCQHFVITTGDEGAIRNTDESEIAKVKEEVRNIDSCAVEINEEEVMTYNVEATASPDNDGWQQNKIHETGNATNIEQDVESVPLDISALNDSLHIVGTEYENTVQRSESMQIRERRQKALEELNASSTADANVAKNVRLSIEESDQNTQSKLVTNVTETYESMEITETYESTETELSILREKKNEEDKNAQAKKDAARQSCEEMGYTQEDIDWAIEEYKSEHDGREDFTGANLAGLIEHRQNAPPSPRQQTPFREVTMLTGDDQHNVSAVVTDLGHSSGSDDHVYEIALPPNRCDHIGCKPKFVVKHDSP